MSNEILKEDIKNNISDILKKYSFKHNCRDIRNAIQNDICKYLSTLTENSSIHDFQCICDETNNTESVVQSNYIMCKISIKFDENANFTVFDATVERQNSTFEELSK